MGRRNPLMESAGRVSRPGGMCACPAREGKGTCACGTPTGYEHPASAGLRLQRSVGGKMKTRYLASVGTALLPVGGIPSLAHDRAKAIQRQRIVVDDQSFKIIQYDNASVRAVQTAVRGQRASYNLRARMRHAIKRAAGCNIVNDYFTDAQVIGTLECPDAKGAAS